MDRHIDRHIDRQTDIVSWNTPQKEVVAYIQSDISIDRQAVEY